ncbi:methane monooxygenase/ammonia monooxygenase subunit A [Nitrosomonas sp.]|uniref:methane monooxygenase/ammonia monooxygenase subunit A n=1 Tax=Nitrosomonas sp. TaxID=42353 RepID=UPI00283D3379|nr:methane monooxygenase/ammonia monooxygenase subunit A [Nitrosomonas sp.]MDR4514355.1 hypothetical protein [Nitrosomonas sp.]
MDSGFVLYPGNWLIFGPTHLLVVVEGVLLSVADYTGFCMCVRYTEYVRLIEQGSLRTFGGHTTVIAAFFSAFCIDADVLCLVVAFGKIYCTAFTMLKAKEAVFR